MDAELAPGYREAASAAFELNPNETRPSRLMARVEGAWVELIAGNDGRLTVAVLVAVNEPLRPMLMTQFNNYNLFHGGYGLMSPQGTGAVYLFKRWPVAALPPEALVDTLRTVKNRSTHADHWYHTSPGNSPGTA